ncbi:ABC transporter substrate-binding protein [Consotaella aegiceratis]|uniref:ABC transporter substrate-binding protein n=1 Tax=Consotaella aegiceratis TaxID=3097961 RepID=UPI002F40DA7A
MSGSSTSGMTRRSVLKMGSLAAAAGIPMIGGFPIRAMAQEAGVLRIATGMFEMNWSPMMAGGPHYRWNSLWWASPMYFDEESKIHPYVVTAWDHNDDFTKWSFELDPKATFSDGSSITAGDIKGSWEMAAMPTTQNYRVDQVLSGVEGYDEVAAGNGNSIGGIKVVDDTHLTVTLKKPDSVFFMRIANDLIPIVKASEARDEDGQMVQEWWSPDNGGSVSGPFKLVEINLDDGHLVFERNENFFGSQPKLDRVEIDVVEDPVTATTLLQRRQYDAHTELVTSTIVSDLGEEFSAGPSIPSGQHFWFNSKSAPFDDPKVRQALILAVDRDGLIKASFPDGPNPKADQILVAVEGVDKDFEPFPYDPEKAKQLLSESSYGGPERLPRLVMAGMTNPAHQAAAQFIIEQWRQNLGISAVEILPTLDNFDTSRVHVIRDDAGTRVPDAAVFLNGVIASTGGTAIGKMNGYNNPKVDELLAQAVTLEADDPKRNDLAQQAQRLFRDDYMFIPWYHEIMSRWANPYVQGMEKNLDWQVIRPWDIAIDTASK